jgi:hypothetical protein
MFDQEGLDYAPAEKDVLLCRLVASSVCVCAPRDAYCGFKSCDNASASALGEPWKGGS